jgi:hypothetical protein
MSLKNFIWRSSCCKEQHKAQIFAESRHLIATNMYKSWSSDQIKVLAVSMD